jgi:4-amino-4-deoxy-L-arabinose transferase-like glycosyltransferase
MRFLGYLQIIYHWLTWIRYKYLIIISLLVHIVFIFIYNTHPGIDGVIYQGVADNINASDDFLSCGAFAGAYWPPLFCIYLSLFLKVFGGAEWLFFLFNVLIALGSVVFAQKYLERIFGELISRWACLFCFNSIIIFYFTLYYKYELLTLFLISLCLLYLLRNDTLAKRDIFFAGLFLGLATLATGRVLSLLPGIVCFIYLSCRGFGWRRGKLISIFILGLILIILPWSIRNYICLDKFIPVTSNSGLNFYTGFNENADGGYLHRNQLPIPFDTIDRTNNSVFYEGGLKFIINNPIRSIVLLLKKINLMWRIHYVDSVFFFPFFYLGIFLLNKLIPGVRYPQIRLVQLMILGYTAFHCFYIARYYYIIPLLPLVFGISISCQHYLAVRLKKRLEAD